MGCNILNAIIVKLSFCGPILKSYKMWIGFSIKELSHLTIPTAIAVVELDMIYFLSREKNDTDDQRCSKY